MHSNILDHDTAADARTYPEPFKATRKNEEYYKSRFCYLGIAMAVLLLAYVGGLVWIATNEVPAAALPAYLVAGALLGFLVARMAKRLNAAYQACFEYSKDI